MFLAGSQVTSVKKLWKKKKENQNLKKKQKKQPTVLHSFIHVFIHQVIHPYLYSSIGSFHLSICRWKIQNADEAMDEHRRLNAEVFIHIFSIHENSIDVFIQPTQGCGARSPGMEYSVERGER